MAESKYAKQLRELGCVPYHELLSDADLRETEDDVQKLAEPFGLKVIQRMSRKERRKLISKGVLPNYHFFAPGCTYITDELGIDWRGPPGLNLNKKLGFTHLDTHLIEDLRKKMN
jgi:hypothetical protein